MKQLFSIIALAIIGCACAKAFSVDTVTVATTRLESPMKVTVITPDGSQGQKYPSVYLLNGYGATTAHGAAHSRASDSSPTASAWCS